MPIEKRLFKELIDPDFIPNWICPTCKLGHLVGTRNDIKTFHSYKSRLEQIKCDYRREESVFGNFIGRLRCSNNICNDVVIFSGEMFVDFFDVGEDGHNIFKEFITPYYFNPSIEVIKAHEYIPNKIRKFLVNSFQVFWIDTASCANKIRMVVENIMDHEKVKKFSIKKGKKSKIFLDKRIEDFKSLNPEVSSLLKAIKWIGNSGSHSYDILNREDLFVAYEMLEQSLDNLYNPHSKKMQSLAKKINKRKGPIRIKKH